MPYPVPSNSLRQKDTSLKYSRISHKWLWLYALNYINRIIQSIYSLLSYHNLIFLFTFATDSSAESLRVVRGSHFYIEKTFTSVCLSYSKLRTFWPRLTNCNEDVLLMCAYIHPSLALRNKERLRVLYISAWAFCVVRSRGRALRRPCIRERTKVSFPRLFHLYSSKVTFTKISSPTGIWAKHTALYGYDSCRTAYRTYSSRPRT